MIYTVTSFQIMTIRRRVIWPRFDFDLAILTHAHTKKHLHRPKTRKTPFCNRLLYF